MFPSEIELRSGAVIVSDAHYSELRPELLGFLQTLEEREDLPQLILMGDIFDLLFGEIPLTHERNQEAVETLRRISEKSEVIYLEGNHDYNLARLFPEAAVFPLSKQPLLCSFEGKSVCLAHGDFGTDLSYRLYTALIRNPLVMRVLNLLNRAGNRFITDRLDAYLAKKDDCRGFSGFESYIRKRLQDQDLEGCDYFIEGHYHQNRQFDIGRCRYINLPAFACKEKYVIVQPDGSEELVKEAVYSAKQ
jgi:UDP-2,3-diacylglucosamine hydrolase